MFDVIGSRIAFQNRWLSLRVDAIRYPNGAEGEYAYIQRPRYAIVAAVQDGRIWMVEQYRHPLRVRSLELPMGVAPDGDATPIAQAAAIELREETGVVAEKFEYIGEVAAVAALVAQTGALFLATGLTSGPQALEETEQDLIAVNVSVEEALERVRDGRIRDGATMASLGLLRLKGLI